VILKSTPAPEVPVSSVILRTSRGVQRGEIGATPQNGIRFDDRQGDPEPGGEGQGVCAELIPTVFGFEVASPQFAG